MDRRETAFDPFNGAFDEKTMIGLVMGDPEQPVRCHWEMCDVCDGRGHHVNPSIDSHGISMQEFNDDPDFADSYWRGDYDVPCAQCGGKRVIAIPNVDDLDGLAFYDEAVGQHFDYIAEREAERRMGA